MRSSTSRGTATTPGLSPEAGTTASSCGTSPSARVSGPPHSAAGGGQARGRGEGGGGARAAAAEETVGGGWVRGLGGRKGVLALFPFSRGDPGSLWRLIYWTTAGAP